MLRKLKILMLLATIVTQSLSAPPEKPDPLEELAKQLGISVEEFNCMVRNMRFVLDKVIEDFSLKLMDEFMKDLESERKNILFSPYSIHIVMTMILAGAEKDSDSRRQMIQALDLRNDKYAGMCLYNYRKVLDYYKSEDTGIEQADKIFIKNGFPIHPTYNIFTEGFFMTSASNLDLNPGDAVNQINEYVKKATNGRIKNLMLPGSIKGTTVMLLVDAISHIGEWRFKFEQTSPMTFNFLGGSRTVEYPYGMRMRTNKDLRYLYSQKLDSQILELPYKNPNVRMYIVLPNTNTRAGLERAATGFSYEEVKNELKCPEGGIRVTMPRFKTTFHKNLVDTMVKLGVTDLFDLSKAKLSYITKRFLRVTKIIHKASIEVDEKGSKASAATVAVACTRSFGASGPIDFSVDAPFSLSIVDVWTGITLFNGVILDPTQSDDPDVNGASP